MPKLIKLISSDRFLEAPELLRAAVLGLPLSALALHPCEAGVSGCLAVLRERARQLRRVPPRSNLRKRDPYIPKFQGWESIQWATPSENSRTASTASSTDSSYLNNHTALAQRRATRRSAAIRRGGASPSRGHWEARC